MAGRTIGGPREVRLYSSWCMANPQATKEEHHEFLQSLLDDPNNSLKKKQQQQKAETHGSVKG